MKFRKYVSFVTNETKWTVRASIRHLRPMLYPFYVFPALALFVMFASGCARPAAGVQMNAFETPSVTPTKAPPQPQVATVVVGPASTSLPLGQMKTAAPEATAEPGGAITMQNAESGVTLRVGEHFLLNLGDRDWQVRVGDETIVHPIESAMIPPGSQGYFGAFKVGKTKLYATSDPPCRQNTPPCMMPTLFLEIPITVQP